MRDSFRRKNPFSTASQNSTCRSCRKSTSSDRGIHAETLVQDRMPSVQRIPLPCIEPYLGRMPWSQVLENKKVLVIHPFAASITSQYEKREKLFRDKNILPSFELSTLQAVQSAGSNTVDFDNWFDALESMQTKIKNMDFDVAIIGAGAYGLPLASHVKSIGKQAVHLGGATQMLFGIYGQRWLNDPLRKPFINEHWVRPLPSEKIENALKHREQLLLVALRTDDLFTAVLRCSYPRQLIIPNIERSSIEFIAATHHHCRMLHDFNGSQPQPPDCALSGYIYRNLCSTCGLFVGTPEESAQSTSQRTP